MSFTWRHVRNCVSHQTKPISNPMTILGLGGWADLAYFEIKPEWLHHSLPSYYPLGPTLNSSLLCLYWSTTANANITKNLERYKGSDLIFHLYGDTLPLRWHSRMTISPGCETLGNVTVTRVFVEICAINLFEVVHYTNCHKKRAWIMLISFFLFVIFSCVFAFLLCKLLFFVEICLVLWLKQRWTPGK